MSDAPTDLRTELEPFGQAHLLRFWDELDDAGRRRLRDDIDAIDFARVQSLYESKTAGGGESDADAAARAVTPRSVVRLPRTDEDGRAWAEATAAGEALLQTGTVGAILVAGGQGTRLGFDQPKGMFPVGPVSGATLFEILAGQLLARSRRAGVAIPLYVMTSDATHDATVNFFAEHGRFGLAEGDVTFFKQGTMPAVDDGTGAVLLAAKDRVAVSPDGHGGLVRGLEVNGVLDAMRDRGIEHLYYHQVDNPTAVVCDPAFLGFHALRGSDLSTKVVAKVGPAEKMGVVCDVDGTTRIIEYSDLPDAVAAKTDDDGGLTLWAGNTAIHCFRRDFLRSLTVAGKELPFHVAHKKVPHLAADGTPVEPAEPNAYKFEKFIFDALPKAATALVVETDRAREFNPVKNAEGSDSPATARAALANLARAWLRTAGATVEEDAVVEIDPRFALDAGELAGRIDAGATYAGNLYLH